MSGIHSKLVNINIQLTAQNSLLIRFVLSKSWFCLYVLVCVCLLESLFVCIPVASLRSTQEEYQRKALGAFQRSVLFFYTHVLPIIVPAGIYLWKSNQLIPFIFWIIAPLFVF